MKIFITGATGFLGVNLCRRLVQDGHTLVALLRSETKKTMLPRENVEFLPGDLTSFKDPAFRLPPVDLVVHLAARIKAKEESEFFADNVEAVKDLVACLLRQEHRPQRILFASSIAAAGETLIDRPLDENLPPMPIDPYGESKRAAEQFLLDSSIPVTIFRPPMIFGPDDPKKLRILALANKGLGFKVAGFNQQLSYIYIDDLVDAIAKMTTPAGDDNAVYYLAHPDYTDIQTFWQTAGRALNKPVRIISVPNWVLLAAVGLSGLFSRLLNQPSAFDRTQYRQLAAKAFTCRPDKFQRDFDWRPRHDLASTLSLTVAGYRKVGWL